ncbi:hypothetical protein [Ammoniphilus sp. 3BR4]|uniref:hypothetical protein n=1 Tax=Ammoniphilus sp. 3BR4 TaxID=3158265 RepID=UPI0034652BAA
MTYTEQEILKFFKQACDDMGFFPTVAQYKIWARENRAPSYDVILRHTGKSYVYFKEKFGLPVKEKQTEEKVIAALQEAAEVYGKDLRKLDYIEWYRDKPNERPSLADVNIVFKSFNRAKLVANLHPNKNFYTVETTPEECIVALQTCEQEMGEGFLAADYERWRSGKNYPSIVTIRFKLGDYRKALRKANLNPDAHKIPPERFYQDVYAYVQEKLSRTAYEKWAAKNGHLRAYQFGPNGVFFYDMMKQVLETILEQKKIVIHPLHK